MGTGGLVGRGEAEEKAVQGAGGFYERLGAAAELARVAKRHDMNSKWLDRAFDDFLPELQERIEDDLGETDKKLLKLAYVAGAREAMHFSHAMLTIELLELLRSQPNEQEQTGMQ